jgi:FkbM family methyltransferase
LENRTKHYFQKFLVRKFVGRNLYSKIKFLKIIISIKIGLNYEISDILLKVLNEDDVFVDVGANLGQYMIRISNKFKNIIRIYAFEPVQNNYNILSKYFLKYDSAITIENYAISDVDGTDILYIPLIDNIEIDTQASLDLENRKKYYTNFVEQKIEKMTIDSYMNKKNIEKLDYLKVDTEGNDEKVLKGAFNSITKYKPVIFCEDIKSVEIFDKLAKLNYHIFLLNKDFKLIKFSEKTIYDYFDDIVIFIPYEKYFIFNDFIIK